MNRESMHKQGARSEETGQGETEREGAQRTRSYGKDCSLNRKTNYGRARTTGFTPRNTVMLCERESRDRVRVARLTHALHIHIPVLEKILLRARIYLLEIFHLAEASLAR